jgi:hypothetical protein
MLVPCKATVHGWQLHPSGAWPAVAAVMYGWLGACWAELWELGGQVLARHGCLGAGCHILAARSSC